MVGCVEGRLLGNNVGILLGACIHIQVVVVVVVVVVN